jgi:flagellar motor protein MotB
MKKIALWMTAGIVSVVLVGCFVPEEKYKKLEAEYNRLKEQLSTCQGQVGQIEKEKADLLAREKQTKVTYDQLMGQLQKEVSEGQVAIQQYEDKLTVNVAEKIFFDSGRATLKPGGKEVLKRLGGVIKGLSDKVVRVEGHTDNVQIAKPLRRTYPTNWELSAARATTVVRFLQESVDVPPQMLVAAAYGEYHPIAPNDTPQNKQKNRRIEIVLQNKDVLKRTEAPVAPGPAVSPKTTEPSGVPEQKETPKTTEPPVTPAQKETPKTTEPHRIPTPKKQPVK